MGFFCMSCHRDISMGQGGVKDLKRHWNDSFILQSREVCCRDDATWLIFWPSTA